MWIVEWAKGIEVLGVDFGSTVAPHKVISKKIYTSGTYGGTVQFLAAAISIAVIRFSFPSDSQGSDTGSCEPVRMTGLLKFSSMKLKAEAV